jgi:hypothetical protein
LHAQVCKRKHDISDSDKGAHQAVLFLRETVFFSKEISINHAEQEAKVHDH